MTTEYERYQLEWMIAHGHGLKELMDELTLYQNELLLESDENLTVRDVFDEWVNDQGFGGELFVCEQEWRESEGYELTALAQDNGAFYNPDRGVLIASYMNGYDDPTIEVFKATTADLRKFTSELTEDDIEYGLTTHELAGNNCARICSFRSIDELRDAGYLDSELIDVSDTRALVDAVKDLTSGDSVREWYMATYPDDQLGMKLDVNITFDKALGAVSTGNDFYTALGVDDSLVRERVFEEMSRRYGFTYDEVYDSWLHETPLPSPSTTGSYEKIAVAAGYRFNLVDAQEVSDIDLKSCGTVVTVDGHDYEIMKGATYEDSRKVDDLLDSHGDKPISGFRKQDEQSLDDLCAAKSEEAEMTNGSENHDVEQDAR